MSQPLIRSMYSAFSELAEGGDFAEYVSAHFDPACEYHPVEEVDTVRGHDALLDWNRRWFESWEVLVAEPEDMRESDGGAVFVRVGVRGRASKSGIEIRQHFFHVIEVRGERIASMREFLDEGDALEAAGLSE